MVYETVCFLILKAFKKIIFFFKLIFFDVFMLMSKINFKKNIILMFF